MVTGPATFVVLFAAGMLLVLGALILGGNARRRRRGKRCAGCGKQNVRDARFCAACGETLVP